MKDKIIYRISFIITVIVFLLIGLGVFHICKYFVYTLPRRIIEEANKPKQTCYWKWKDVNGEEGTSILKYCKGKGSNIYCGDATTVHLISEVEKVCEYAK